MAASSIAESVGTVPIEQGILRTALPQIEPHWHAVVAAEAAADKFLADLEFIRPTSSNPVQNLPPALREPSSLTAAFSRMFRETQFRETLEAMAKEVGETADAEIYMVRWSYFIGDLIEKSFLARALLEAAAVHDSPIFDRAAATQIGKIEKMVDWARMAFQSQIEGDLRKSWAFRLVGFQLEQIFQPMNTVNYYPQVLKVSDAERTRKWRDIAITEISRMADPMMALRGIEDSSSIDEARQSSPLRFELPKQQMDLFFASPDGERIDLDAIERNARSFYHLWGFFTDVAREAGRDPSFQAHLAVKYNPKIGTFLIKDKNPVVDGALYPFGTEPPRSRLYSIVDQMGSGAYMDMTQVPAASYKLLNGRTIARSSIGKIVLQLPDNLAPKRSLTLTDAVSSKHDLKKLLGDSDAPPPIQVAFEDSGVNPLDTMFAEIAAEAGDEAAAAASISTSAAASQATTGALAFVAPVLLKG